MREMGKKHLWYPVVQDFLMTEFGVTQYCIFCSVALIFQYSSFSFQCTVINRNPRTDQSSETLWWFLTTTVTSRILLQPGVCASLESSQPHVPLVYELLDAFRLDWTSKMAKL